MKQRIASEPDMKRFGEKIGAAVNGGEFIELIGDIGAGKTTFTKGLAVGLGIEETVQSPTFTISRVYDGRDNLRLAHYDFYRLNDAGIMADEMAETITDSATIVVVEWGDIVSDVSPSDRLTLTISTVSDTERSIDISANGVRSLKLLERIK